MKKEIENLDTKKSSTYGSIPATILKQCINAYLPRLMNSINYSKKKKKKESDLLNGPGPYDKGAKDPGSNAVLWL